MADAAAPNDGSINPMKSYSNSSVAVASHKQHLPANCHRTMNGANFNLAPFTDMSAYPKFETLEDIIGSAEELIRTTTTSSSTFQPSSRPTPSSTRSIIDSTLNEVLNYDDEDGGLWQDVGGGIGVCHNADDLVDGMIFPPHNMMENHTESYHHVSSGNGNGSGFGMDPIPIDTDTLQVVNGIKLGSLWRPDQGTIDLLKSLWVAPNNRVGRIVSAPEATAPADTPLSSSGGDANTGEAAATAASSMSGAASSSSFKQEQWNERYEELVQYREKYGHCLVPHGWNENKPLAQWVKRQRYQYKLRIAGRHTTLTDERCQMLVDLGFVWNAHDAMWEEKFAELVDYEKSHGNCNVPSTYPQNRPLSVWVRCQRRNYKLFIKQQRCGVVCTSNSMKSITNHHQNNNSNNNGGGMTMERVHKLQSLGFSFNPRNL